MLPLWVMTALRSIAVIGFLLASRLKHIAFRELRQGWKPEPVQDQETPREPVAPHIDYTALANALVDAMQHKGASGRVNVSEEQQAVLPSPDVDSTSKWEPAATTASGSGPQRSKRRPSSRSQPEEAADVKLARAYAELQAERTSHQVSKPISARDLSQRANVRRSTCSQWLRQQGASQAEQESTENVLLLGVDIPVLLENEVQESEQN